MQLDLLLMETSLNAPLCVLVHPPLSFVAAAASPALVGHSVQGAASSGVSDALMPAHAGKAAAAEDMHSTGTVSLQSRAATALRQILQLHTLTCRHNIVQASKSPCSNVVSALPSAECLSNNLS